METITNVFTTLGNSDNPVVALMSAVVLALSGVVVYQWRYTTSNTVPKFIWDDLSAKIEKILSQNGTVITILQERNRK